MKNKVYIKSNNLSENLTKYFGENMNLARIKFFALFISSLCKVQTVCFEKLASGFDTSSQSSSSLRRIQRFMANYALDKDLIAKFVFALLPHEPPYTLAIDRTNWKFGETNINIFVLSIVYKGLSFPILFKLMDKRGNSNTKERIQIINHFIQLFGREKIKYIVADREFVGDKWIEFLNVNKLNYYIRIRENFYVTKTKNGDKIKASWLFNDLNINQCKAIPNIYYLNNQLCYLSASKIKNKKGIPELQIIISFNNTQNAIEIYKDRWQIETAFKTLKSSGFNIEDTHLTDLMRIEKLLSIVIVAFTWAYIVGIHLHENVKPIRILKHGKRAKSFVKYGLQYIATVLLNAFFIDNIDVFNFLSCT